VVILVILKVKNVLLFIPMWNKNLLDSLNLSNLNCKEFNLLREEISYKKINHFTEDDFISMFEQRIKEYKFVSIIGLEKFIKKQLIMGCHHFIDNLLLEYNIKNLQIFEHDYSYYKKLYPNIKYATYDSLENNKPLLIAMPFPGHLNIHNQFKDILKKCDDNNIDVHIDASWLPASFNAHYDISNNCVKSIAMSLSKAYCMGWNRIGIRWSKEYNENDSISIMNKSHMIPVISYKIGCLFLENFELDYIVKIYKNRYEKLCKDLKLRPSNIIHAAFSIDKSKLFGLKKLLEDVV
jgi:hypothetical protein